MKNGEEQVLRFAVYSRKSRITGRGESIENQAEFCREYIFSHYPRGGREAISLYEDEGFSGGNTNRPRFQKMMRDAERGKFSIIVCYRLDRISRNIGDFALLIEKLNRLGVSFVSIREQFDTESPLGRAMMYIASVFSQLERETIAERIRDNMLELSKSGRWLGGVTPTGYVSETEEHISPGGGKKKSCRLRIVPEEAERIRLIFEEYRKTGSLTQVETRLVRDGIRTKNGKLYSRFAIRKILENPVYMTADRAAHSFFSKQGAEVCGAPEDFDGERGVMAYNKTLQKPGKANRLRDMKEWIIAAGGHRGIVSGEEWVHVQEMLGKGRAKTYRKPKNHKAILSGLFFCGRCGSYLRPKTNGKGGAAGESFHYLCTMKEKSRGEFCRVKNPPGKQLDTAAIQTVSLIEPDRLVLTEALDAYRKKLHDTVPENGLPSLRRNLKSNRQEIRSLVTVLGEAGEAPARRYLTEAINRLHEENHILERTICELEREEEKTVYSPTELEKAFQTLLSPEALLSGAETEEKRTALRTLVQRAVWDGERCHLYFIGAELPRSNAEEEIQ